MPRHPRLEAAGATHHVVVQGSGRRAFVEDDRDRTRYLDRFQTEAALRGWTIHASSLLDTHHHAVVTTEDADLGTGMGRVVGGYASWFNARHARAGAVFSERFWSRRAEAHVVRACVYALVNPVVAGLATHPRRWCWSSYADIERHGCSQLIAEITGGTHAFLALVDEAADRVRHTHPETGPATWRLVSEIVAEGRG